MQLSDWYSVSRKDVIDRGGATLFENKYSSLEDALRALYPDYPWQTGKFLRTTSGFWKDLTHQRELIDKIALELGITQVSSA